MGLLLVSGIITTFVCLNHTRTFPLESRMFVLESEKLIGDDDTNIVHSVS